MKNVRPKHEKQLFFVVLYSEFERSCRRAPQSHTEQAGAVPENGKEERTFIICQNDNTN